MLSITLTGRPSNTYPGCGLVVYKPEVSLSLHNLIRNCQACLLDVPWLMAQGTWPMPREGRLGPEAGDRARPRLGPVKARGQAAS